MNKLKNDDAEILLGSKGYVDFSFPISMSLEQRASFIKLLKTIFDPRVIIESKVDIFTRDWRIGERVMYPREWTPEELLVLLESKETEEIVESLGRSWYASQLKDADWRYRFLAWEKKNKKRLSKKDKLEIIREFVKEHEDEIKSRRLKRKELRKLKKELGIMNSDEKQKILDDYKRRGWKDRIKDFNNRKKEIENRIKILKKQLKEY